MPLNGAVLVLVLVLGFVLDVELVLVLVFSSQLLAGRAAR
jgi:hypothetical protein